MKYLLLLLPMVVVGCAGSDSYSSRYGYNEGRYGYNEGSPAYTPGYGNQYNQTYTGSGYNQTYSGTGYGQSYPDDSYRRTYSRNSYNRSYAENCGTPDEPRACPPMPRHPLPYYPGDR